MQAFEVNFDGLIGPTHNYAGLSFGNIASENNRGSLSSPKTAALQGLEKMKRLHDMGIKQAVLPPQPRPAFAFLKNVGFNGSDQNILAQTAQLNPQLLANAYSASAMWTANAAIVSPSADTRDGKVHITPANLITTLHRSLETQSTANILRQVFYDPDHFVHHDPLPAHSHFADEGAANHTRFAAGHGSAGVELFVYGRNAQGDSFPKIYPARQTRQACEAIVRNHLLDPHKVLLVQQNPTVVDQGVFHNDVICVANETALLYHEDAFVDTISVIEQLEHLLGAPLHKMCVRRQQVSVQKAVQTYLFNSQLVTLPQGGMAVIAPLECQKSKTVRACLDALANAPDTPVNQIHYFNVRESMRNGGGPACLRWRVVLTPAQFKTLHPHVLFTESLYERLKTWVHKHYRDRLSPPDLADPKLADESRNALAELEKIVQLSLL